MKKIINLLLMFIILASFSACSNSSQDKIYGFWKSEKVLDAWSGTHALFIISENEITKNEEKFTNTTLSNENNIWVTNEVEVLFGVPIKYGFKLINDNELEIITFAKNEKQHSEIYKKISEEEAKKLLSSKKKELKSYSDPF